MGSALAVAIALQLAQPDIPASALAPEPTPDAAKPPAAVTDLASQVGDWGVDPATWQVSLRWKSGDDRVREYAIIRDGVELSTPKQTRYVDRDVEPDAAYVYEVIAVSDDELPSKPTRVRVRTDPLPLDLARVDGRWQLHAEIVSSSIDADDGSFIVRFDAACDVGPCDVTFAFEPGNDGRLALDDPTYAGTGVGPFYTRDCHGDPVSSTTVSMSFRVIEARALRHEWRASRIKGTLRESVPSLSNCLAATNSWTFEGQVQA